MKKYNHTNFFKHTYCEFQEVVDFDFPEENAYKSDSNSYYHYTIKGVYRKSNHWGRVANCRWRLRSTSKYKNQNTIIGFAKWGDFYPINTSDKRFYITVDFTSHQVDYKVSTENASKFLFSYVEVMQRMKEIKKLLQKNSWIQYLGSNPEMIQKAIINDLINSSDKIISIKKKYLN